VQEIKLRTAKENITRVKTVKERCTRKRGELLSQQIDLWNQDAEEYKNFFQMLATVFAKAATLQIAVEIINGHILDRVREGKRGQARDARIKSTDVNKARADLRHPQYTTRWVHMGLAELKQHQITYGITGILEPLAANHFRYESSSGLLRSR
jgi:hypothetical protein